MAQKIVTFEVAKALKEAGYPQGDKNSGLTNVYPLEDHDDNYTPYTRIGKLTTNYHCQTFRVLSDIPFVVAPTYIDAWLWLWREKEIRILLEDAKNPEEPEIERGCYVGTNQLGGICSSQEFADPEDAIVDIIEYFVRNDLMK